MKFRFHNVLQVKNFNYTDSVGIYYTYYIQNSNKIFLTTYLGGFAKNQTCDIESIMCFETGHFFKDLSEYFI